MIDISVSFCSQSNQIYSWTEDRLMTGLGFNKNKNRNKFRGVNGAFSKVVEVDMDPHVASYLHGLHIQCQDLM